MQLVPLQYDDEEDVPKTEEEMLWVTPDNLSVRKMEGEETADRWLTGIVEVQLPMDYKLRNIEVGRWQVELCCPVACLFFMA
jgi:hypothetical protein